MNIFTHRGVVGAFARVEKLLGGQSFSLADGRALMGILNRVRRGETTLDNGSRINADAVLVATRPQFTPAGQKEKLPAALDNLTVDGERWRAEFVESDEVHVTLYLARQP